MPSLQSYPANFVHMASRVVSLRTISDHATWRLTIFQYSGRSYSIKFQLLLCLLQPHIPHQILPLTITLPCLCNYARRRLCSSPYLESPPPLATWEIAVHSESQFRCSLMCKAFCNSLGELRGWGWGPPQDLSTPCNNHLPYCNYLFYFFLAHFQISTS